MITRVCRTLLLITLLSITSAQGIKFKPIKKREKSSCTASMMVNTGRLLRKTYSFLNSNLDYMLTSKGCKKTVMILIPFVVLYGHYFGLDPVKDVARGLLNTVGRAQAYYYLQVKIGRNQQIIDEISEQPWNMFCMTAIELIRSIGSKIKIPFIM